MTRQIIAYGIIAIVLLAGIILYVRSRRPRVQHFERFDITEHDRP